MKARSFQKRSEIIFYYFKYKNTKLIWRVHNKSQMGKYLMPVSLAWSKEYQVCKESFREDWLSLTKAEAMKLLPENLREENL